MRRYGWAPAVVIAAGVGAALHVAKLAPAIPALQAALGVSLVQAGFLISTVQVASMLLGALLGGLADGLGLRRCMLAGLCLLTVASGVGPGPQEAHFLLWARAVEGVGFLLVVTPAAALLRRLVAPHRLALALGVWGCYMPLATSLALLLGPLWIPVAGWPAWWWGMAGVTGLLAMGMMRLVPPDRAPAVGEAHPGVLGRLKLTLSSPGPWWVAAGFGVYSGQWLAVVGFLPSVYAAAGIPSVWAGVMTAVVALGNMLGNLASGVLLQRGGLPVRLLRLGYAGMAVGALLAFQSWWDIGAAGRYGGVLAFSALGGLVPGTLFSLAVRLAPSPQVVSTTVGWMQQCSSLGQFGGPPLVAMVAAWHGGWDWTGGVTGLCCLAGGFITWGLARHERLARTI